MPLAEVSEKTNIVINRQHSSKFVISLHAYLTEEKGICDYRFQANLDIQTRNSKGKKNMAMKVEIRDNKLCIEIDLEKPTPSASGKTLVVASTRGNTVTTAEVDGKPVIIGLNAYIKP